MKVLVVDRNNYYGGESASLNLTNLHEKFRGSKPSPGVSQHPIAP
jgi:Rab GDP dissociation inhibitor